ncbi:MAG: TrmJ/YjtD family RNA methyltransferase [Gammaproteobacteria bacterium]
MQPLDHIRTVLVGTSHPGNIGAAARALKTMGLSTLALVEPRTFPDAEATARAAGASDLLAAASVHASLDEALAGCEYVIGASARRRTIEWPTLTPRAAAERIAAEFAGRRVAMVFGRERTGLDNAELERCHALVTIDANPGYSSLNLAAAVQVVAYEIRVAHLSSNRDAESVAPTARVPVGAAPSRRDIDRLATADEMEQLYAHLERVMVATGFLDPDAPRHLMRRLRRLFNRAQLDDNEMNILRGLLSSIEQPTGKKHRGPV